MPMPWTYRQASREWQAFLGDARDAMDLSSDNVTFTAVQGVCLAFRRRLTPQQAVDFAQVLPVFQTFLLSFLSFFGIRPACTRTGATP